MLHTNDDFLNAIAADPAERTLRLVYADWLTEHDDPRGELIRIEEEMRLLPAFADRFWELKPRRNELRAVAGAEWCAALRYGTECLPVFAHGIPDGWRERWRLIREFTERWYDIPMPDVGGHAAEVAEAEKTFEQTFPPSLREWVAFGADLRASEATKYFHNDFQVEPFPYDEYPVVCLYTACSGSSWFGLGVRDEDLAIPDPPIFTSHSEQEGDPAEPEGSVTECAFWYVSRGRVGDRHAIRTLPVPEFKRLANQVQTTFTAGVLWGQASLYETDDVFVAFDARPREDDDETIWVKVSRDRAVETLPAFLQPFFSPPRSIPPDPDNIPF
ncbi:MAG: TIGR02996 domain-containing protein [Gemmataceae bacterium]|nr:TIGR02996 domain-containing protein [Gemmataceae bacterium]